jgi:hypothetical protein
MAKQGELYKFISNWLEQTPPPASECRAAVDTAAMVMSWAIFGAGLQWSRGARRSSVAVLTGGLREAVQVPFLEQQGQDGQMVR